MRIPLRVRVTLASAVATAAILAGFCAFLYLNLSASTLHSIDQALVARADAIAASAGQGGLAFDTQRAAPGDGAPLVQIVDRTGNVLEGTTKTPMLAPSAVQALRAPRLFDVRATIRVYALPVTDEGGRFVVLVGSPLAARAQTLHRVLLLSVAGSAGALGIAALVAFLLSVAALRPVERMRKEAAAISASEPERRLSVPSERELRRLGETLNDMMARVQDARETEQRLVDDASHELRTPLAILKGELDLALSRRRSADELRETVVRAAAETDRLVRLAEDLLVLARANDGKLPVQRARIDVRPLLEQARASRIARAQDASATIRIDANVDRVDADPIRLRQAIDNLLDNAIRHSPAGGEVLLAAQRSDGSVEFSVQDQGEGFPDRILAQAFEPFSRGAHADADRGAGLGLAIVRSIAEAHGGSARARNLSHGARVEIVLPLDAPA